jgi:acyl phosphate:glycerol-3-phosphate acyltransferase
MTPELSSIFFWIISYLIGAIPFGYLVGKIKGVDLFKTGSGNIGATNVGRVLGKKYGFAVFALDFLKGIAPTALAPTFVAFLSSSSQSPWGITQLDQVGAAVATFLGHLYPVYLRFRGGKGVATGAGAALVVAPIPMLLGLVAWITFVLVSRMVSVASIAAAVVIIAVRIMANGFHSSAIAGTLFCILAGLIVVVKHRANIKRIIAGNENTIKDTSQKRSILAGLHILSLGFWFGGAAFFNFIIAPAIFSTFEDYVVRKPHAHIIDINITEQSKKLEQEHKVTVKPNNVLAGTAVAPVFPRITTYMTVCGLVALITSYSWYKYGKIHRIRSYLLFFALAALIINWPIAETVSQLRVDRYVPHLAEHANKLFGPIHLLSMAIGAIANILAGIALFLAGLIPKENVIDGVP